MMKTITRIVPHGGGGWGAGREGGGGEQISEQNGDLIMLNKSIESEVGIMSPFHQGMK